MFPSVSPEVPPEVSQEVYQEVSPLSLSRLFTFTFFIFILTVKLATIILFIRNNSEDWDLV